VKKSRIILVLIFEIGYGSKQTMDFLTAFPYWGIIVVIIVNAVIVSRMTIRISEQPEEDGDGNGGGEK
jgi:hypothetical protein